MIIEEVLRDVRERLVKAKDKTASDIAEKAVGQVNTEFEEGIIEGLNKAIGVVKRYKFKKARPFTVYLSGAIDGLSYEEAAEGRDRLTAMLAEVGIATRDPMRWSRACEDMRSMTLEAFEEHLDYAPTINEITMRDLHDLDASDAILVLTGDKPSWGTTGEFWKLVWTTDKPRCVICPGEQKSGWLRSYATRIVGTDEEAVETLKAWAELWDPPETLR